ncbi:aldolase [Sphingobium sp. C100]|jgi:serine kinase of HPr protein (carbohydrate metabolism regulator)|uniref:HPr kinase/phosphorylase n=1 Tax=Sphingobium sp. C100 TaxID=1207055 RepID=UPI0003D5B301|nr:HPr kinase/phosphatase C-terminal domain-containing protein [Sphingobium sp. C100]ETI60962.1 aldolase [Sphingobium sp. C100]
MARTPSSETLHATSVAIDGRAVLLCGPSGVGKSDLALRLIDRGAILVSDDYTLVQRVDGALRATAPATIAGKMEVRSLGIISMPHMDAPVALLADLFDQVDRMPLEPVFRAVAGMQIPVIKIAPFEVSAAIKVELALRTLAPL